MKKQSNEQLQKLLSAANEQLKVLRGERETSERNMGILTRENEMLTETISRLRKGEQRHIGNIKKLLQVRPLIMQLCAMNDSFNQARSMFELDVDMHSAVDGCAVGSGPGR